MFSKIQEAIIISSIYADIDLSLHSNFLKYGTVRYFVNYYSY